MKVPTSIAAALLFVALCPPAAEAAPAGTLDPAFGIGGKRTFALSASGGVERPQMVRDAAGRIYLISSHENMDQETVNIVRLHHDGAIDTGYGGGGIATTVLPQGFHLATAAAMQSDGHIVLGFEGNTGMGLKACRLLRDGSLDPSFGLPSTPGCTDMGPEVSDVNAIVVQQDGRIVLAGEKINSQGVVARLEADGRSDEGFGEEGVFLLGPDSNTVFHDAVLAPNGDVVAVGDAGSFNSEFLLVRLAGADGQPVGSFGTNGFLTIAFDIGSFKHDVAFAVATLPDGGIVAAGYAQTDLAGSARPAVVKLTASGAPDLGFGPGGKRHYDPCAGYAFGCDLWIYDLAALPGERLVLTGRVGPTLNSDGRDFLAMRILANGLPDPDFGHPASPGTVTVPFNLGPDAESADTARTLLLEGERILLAGTAEVATGDPGNPVRDDFAIARLDHGRDEFVTVTPMPGPGGTLSPAAPQQLGHSDRGDFVFSPDPGFILDRIEKGPNYCDAGLDGDIVVTAPVIASCELHVSFKRRVVFADGFE